MLVRCVWMSVLVVKMKRKRKLFWISPHWVGIVNAVFMMSLLIYFVFMERNEKLTATEWLLCNHLLIKLLRPGIAIIIIIIIIITVIIICSSISILIVIDNTVPERTRSSQWRWSFIAKLMCKFFFVFFFQTRCHTWKIKPLSLLEKQSQKLKSKCVY